MADCADTIEGLLDTLADVITQAVQGSDDVLDSMGILAYANGLRVLAEHDRVYIIADADRQVIAEWSTR